MKHRLELYPPLVEIERRLFGVSDGLLRAVEAGEVSERIQQAVRGSEEWKTRRLNEFKDHLIALDGPPPAIPSYVRDLIRRRAAVAEAKFDAPPVAGQIVEVTAIKTPQQGQLDWVMQVPLFVLLESVAENRDLWHGWLVSAETDYATSWDFVLQEQDDPFDPEAAMVQVWNPVRIYLPMAGRVVAQLRPERLQALRSLAADFLLSNEPNEPARPGKVGVRSTSAGLAVATGTPIDGKDDPRLTYQRMYHYAAEAVREPARLAIADLVSTSQRIAALIKRLSDAARSVGEMILPVPQVEVPMRTRATSVPNVRKGHERISNSDALAEQLGSLAEPNNTWLSPLLTELTDSLSNATKRLDMMEEMYADEERKLVSARDTLHSLLKLVESARSQSVNLEDASYRTLEGRIAAQMIELQERLKNSAETLALMRDRFDDLGRSFDMPILRFQEHIQADLQLVEIKDTETNDYDLAWHDIARIRFVSVTPDGGGQLLVIPGRQPVVAQLRVAGVTTDKIIARPGDDPTLMAWEAEREVELVLSCDDGRKVALPLLQVS